MPKYTVPKPKKGKEGSEVVGLDNYVPELYFPANKEMLDELEIGDTVEVRVVGKVIGLEAREGESNASHEFRVALKSVETYGENEFEKLSRDDD